MKRIHLLILRSYFGPFIATFFIAVFVLLMQFLWKYIDDLVGKGLEITILAELIFYASATFVPMALPLAILLSSLMTFGNLGEYYELTALKASGVSLQRIMMPLIVVSVIISVTAFVFSNNILPIANLKFRTLLYDIRHQRPDINIQPGIFYKGIDNYVIKIAGKNYKTKMMYKLMVYDHTDNNGNTNITVSDSATMHVSTDENNMILTMYNGSKYEELPEERKQVVNMTYPHRHSTFDKETIALDLSGFGLKRTNEDLFKDNQEMLNITQLMNAVDSLTVAFEKRKEFFGKNLLLSTYFKRENKIDSIAIVLDTIYKYDIDSVYESFELKERKKIIDMASNFARSAQTYVSTTVLDYEFRDRYIIKHNIEWHRKFSLSFACLVLFFIGAPLGAIIKKGGFGMPVVVAVVFFIFYYVIMIVGEKTAKEGIITVYQGMWLSAFILLPVGIFLTSKATTDSVIFDIDPYRMFIRKIFGIEKIKQRKLNKLIESLPKQDYTDAELLVKLREINKLTKEYQSNFMRRITYKMAIGDLIKVKGKDELTEIFKIYKEIYGILLIRAREHKYFKEKLTEFPTYKLRKLNSNAIFLLIKALILIILPLGFILTLARIIGIVNLRNKLKLMNNLSTDIIGVVEDPAFFNLKK